MSENIYTQGEYLENNPTWHIEDSPWKANQILKMIERNNLFPNSISEIGCGAGEILNQLSIKMPQPEFVGYEISPQAFQLCQQRHNSRIKFLLGNLLEDQRAKFDLVLAIDVIEHVEDIYGFLKNLRDKGEYKIFHIPLDLSVQTVLRKTPILKGRNDLGHIHYFTKELAEATLIDAGYQVIDSFYTASAIDLPARSIKSFLAKVPRKLMFKLNQDVTVRVFGGYSLMVLAK